MIDGVNSGGPAIPAAFPKAGAAAPQTRDPAGPAAGGPGEGAAAAREYALFDLAARRFAQLLPRIDGLAAPVE